MHEKGRSASDEPAWEQVGPMLDEIVAKLNDMIPRGRLYFVVDTLEYLAKGGRIGGAKRLLAELLVIKPILQVKDGQIEPFEQQCFVEPRLSGRSRRREGNGLVERIERIHVRARAAVELAVTICKQRARGRRNHSPAGPRTCGATAS